MKIGVLIRDFEILENWELRIIESIKNDPNLELSLLIKDGRPKEKVKVTIGSFIIDKQVSFEKGRYLKNCKSVDKADLIRYLNTIPTLIFKPKNNGNMDLFNEEDVQQVKKFQLDVILKHSYRNIGGELLTAAKNGIWYMYHSDIKHDRSGPPGFWEVLKKDAVVGVSLLQLTKENNRVNLIDQAFFNRHKYSFVETNFKVLESSVSLVLKNLRKFSKKEVLVIEKDQIFSENINSPKLPSIFKYQLKYYFNLGKGFLRRFESFFGKHTGSWTLFIGKGNFLDADLSKLVSVKKPKNQFWADPFLFKYKKEMYVFFEKFPFATQRGIISCGRVEGNTLVDVIDVLDLEYHLSYPFIFEEEGEIYMMPETNANNRLEIYKCIQFPDKWELYNTAFDGESIADSFFYTDNLLQKWLFLNKSSGVGTSLDNELYIYRVDSINLNKIEEHKQNPIYIDSRVARNGGAFFSYKGKVYRPSQRNVDGVYGKALNINQIEKLTIDEYIEKTIKKIEPNSLKGLVTMHHLHQLNEIFVLDAAFKYQQETIL